MEPNPPQQTQKATNVKVLRQQSSKSDRHSTNRPSSPHGEVTTKCGGLRTLWRMIRVRLRALRFRIFNNPERSRRRHKKLVETVREKQAVRKQMYLQQRQHSQNSTSNNNNNEFVETVGL